MTKTILIQTPLTYTHLNAEDDHKIVIPFEAQPTSSVRISSSMDIMSKNQSVDVYKAVGPSEEPWPAKSAEISSSIFTVRVSQLSYVSIDNIKPESAISELSGCSNW